jgi:hypoxanthine-DNA glycosylase
MSQDGRRAAGFAPVARADARILILGSLPGQRSIAEQQYYAHPQNAFWKIMAELACTSGSYEQRCTALLESRIALWDVLANSVRPGSLDADIRLATAETNDFENFLAAHAGINLILFNGRKAAEVFRRRVLPDLARQDFRLLTMPSTSPAYAAINYAEKLRSWRAAIS